MHFLPAWGTVQLILCPILCSRSYHTDPMWVSFGKNDSKPKKGKKKRKLKKSTGHGYSSFILDA